MRDYDKYRYFALQKSDSNSIENISKSLQAEIVSTIGALQDHFLVRAEKGRNLMKRMADIPEIPWFEEQIPYRHLWRRDQMAAQRELRAALNLTDPGFNNQWHLVRIII
jgi:hypothetical protein